MVVNGAIELQDSSLAQVKQAFLHAAKDQQIPVIIGVPEIEGNSPSMLHAHIDIDGSASKRGADVFAALALDHAESRVLGGENSGRRLMHAAVALEIVHIGKLEKGKTFSQDFQTRLKPGVDPKNLRLIVFVQEPGPGEVLGAALKEARHGDK
jgi:hypothetical protein